ncbi:MAG: PAS domain-containing protein [Gemmatimonadales bacterium]
MARGPANSLSRETGPAGEDRRLANQVPARAAQALWRALADGLPYYVALISPEGRLLYLNRTADGAPPPETWTGQSVFELIPRLEPPLKAAFDRVAAGGAPTEVDFPFTFGDVTRWLRVALSVVRGDTTEPLGVLGIAQDVTEARQTAIELRMSVNALNRLVEAREQLAADLHDGILQSLYGIGLRIEAARAATSDEAAAAGHLDRALGQVRASMSEIRRFIRDERASSALASWEETLAGMLRGLVVTGGPSLTLSVPPAIAARVPEASRRDLVFVAREAVSNAMRHSGGTMVAVRLLDRGNGIRLEIEDDGRGLGNEGGTEGFGLLNMTRRASQIGATLTLQPGSVAGTVVILDIPNEGDQR